jgi:hypothetical protein
MHVGHNSAPFMLPNYCLYAPVPHVELKREVLGSEKTLDGQAYGHCKACDYTTHPRFPHMTNYAINSIFVHTGSSPLNRGEVHL